MKIFQCSNCQHPIYFENHTCEQCRYPLGFLGSQQVLSALTDCGGDTWSLPAAPGQTFRYCANHFYGVCNWLVPTTSDKVVCEACDLNRTIPNLKIPENVEAWGKVEQAKHRLVYSLLRFNLPVHSKQEYPDTGIAFDFVAADPSDPLRPEVKTGHADGVITLDIAEADPVYREHTRTQMRESYRTLIGHFRHEIGHYFWDQLIASNPTNLAIFRDLFGNEMPDYNQSLTTYYEMGPPPNWSTRYLSAYSSAHPWEDWAECWAHYFHLVDTLETAHAFGVSLSPHLENVPSLHMSADFDPYEVPSFDTILDACLPLTFAINSLNRSMGQPDLYPFVLPPLVVQKLRFIHDLLATLR